MRNYFRIGEFVPVITKTGIVLEAVVDSIVGDEYIVTTRDVFNVNNVPRNQFRTRFLPAMEIVGTPDAS